ncbi:ABC transporter substrate-binding protein [Mesorhizobium sp. M1A.F.Ca.ET.072.01.1.1]|uniref:ABC transporter substrate-binding protein n=1 Tax=Mesorhizobium sp. M1A.F.Ca.ET.072.01.1.1 TaxID=2496753 RepID=UPI000FD51F4C|nr:ABC transporter substrate-binding protein [Mesorhizobium sp. M1A.F.Ca.ET.072.01.1.1]RUW51106.1 ABC transporter substrate-binding protein [Mesorhizobium sp. M1A.F.Ca.ET.072.01.1.1]TIV03089.1 MAG: extracellular solute-binding protein [Mesorhizobium sp.]
MTINFLNIVAALAVAGGAVVLTEPAFAGDQLTVVSWGGAAQAAQRKVYFEPFTKKTGIGITEGVYSGELAKIRAMVESQSVSWDVISGGQPDIAPLCDEGLLETIDWQKLGLDRASFGDGGKFDCGVPLDFSATIVGYDRDKLPHGPTTIADLFDTKKFPGKRGLYKGPFPNLEWALVADGVPAQDVYKVLGTSEGVDRAFKKLDTIKKDVMWWTAGAQPPQFLADGQVVMTASWNGRMVDANKNSGKHFAIMWDAAQLNSDYWIIPKGSPHLDAAYKFIAFANSPQPQAEFTQYFPSGPGNPDALKLIDPVVLQDLPNTPEHLAHALPVDYTFGAEKGEEMTQRFNAWLTR